MRTLTREQWIGAGLALALTTGTLGCMVAKQGDLKQAVKQGKAERLTSADIPAPQNRFGLREALAPSYAPAPPVAKAIPQPLGFAPSTVFPDYPPMAGNRERYDGKEVSPVKLAASEPVSTFAIDVDTGAYANTRRMLRLATLPPKEAVRTEEMVNYFRYDYPLPQSREVPFSVTTDLALTPWNPETRLLRIGLRGYDLPAAQRPPANLVFLVDVSGSMDEPDKLPLVKATLATLAEQLAPRDKVAIVVYAGAAGVVLEPTSSKRAVLAALDRLQAGGSTAGGEGLKLAYATARSHFINGGVNRVILATDGDFNVGVSDTKALIGMIERERDSGVTLTTLGFGQGNYNEAMMEQVADHGNGNYAYIDSAMEARKVLAEEMASTLFTIASDVKIQVEFNPAVVAQYRLIGYENRVLREEDFDNDLVDAGEIGAGHQVTALYEIVPVGAKGWIGPRRYQTPAPAGKARSGEMALIRLRYKLPQGGASRLIERTVPAASLAAARAPGGDMAFAVAVAAYGQRLRGDAMLNGFGWTGIAGLAGAQSNPWRREFSQLVGLAGTLERKGGA
jgi:Ca-activated chloride channel homolog